VRHEIELAEDDHLDAHGHTDEDTDRFKLEAADGSSDLWTGGRRRGSRCSALSQSRDGRASIVSAPEMYALCNQDDKCCPCRLFVASRRPHRHKQYQMASTGATSPQGWYLAEAKVQDGASLSLLCHASGREAAQNQVDAVLALMRLTGRYKALDAAEALRAAAEAPRARVQAWSGDEAPAIPHPSKPAGADGTPRTFATSRRAAPWT